ncbi:MAG TPA: tetratricopeptide repeat protein [Terriglobales bacterium]|nr:tetratricopeptide repeat protein [Terriglobales bacterium]
MERRLATILAADMVGYSLRMGSHEVAALDDLMALRQILQSRIVAAGGRLFAKAGDGMLAEFASPVAAVRAAFDVQRDITVKDDWEATRPELRIGLHLADVIVDGEDLLGDGVNIAARIESAAFPGSVTLSQQVFDQVRRVSQLVFEELGQHHLKNITEPVTLFRVRGELPLHSYTPSPVGAGPVAMPAAAMARAMTAETVRGEAMPAATPGGAAPAMAADPAAAADRAALVVLPFDNPGQDPDQDYFADGFSEEVMVALARFRGLMVVARNAAMAFKGRAVDPRQLGRDLGVGWCLRGSVRRLGDKVRITSELDRAATGEQIWADRADCPFASLFDLLDDLASRITATIVGRIEASATAAARRKRPSDLGAYDCLLRGLDYHRLGGTTKSDAEQAVHWFGQAIEKDPEFGRAYAWRACARANRGVIWSGDMSWVADCMADANRALELDDQDAEVHRIMGALNLFQKKYDLAEYHYQRALEINPNHAYIVSRMAELYNYVGDAEKALACVARARQLDPFMPDYCREDEAIADYLLGRYREVGLTVQKMQRISLRGAVYRAAAAAHLDDAEARTFSAREVKRIDPAFQVDQFLSFAPFRAEESLNSLRQDLAMAGLA